MIGPTDSCSGPREDWPQCQSSDFEPRPGVYTAAIVLDQLERRYGLSRKLWERSVWEVKRKTNRYVWPVASV